MQALESLCGWTDSAPTSATAVAIPANELISATAAVSKAVRRIEAACERVRVHVLPFDRMLFGDLIESVEELAVRGQVFMVTTCLRHLREVLPSPRIHLHRMDPVWALFREFPGGIEQVIRYAELELHRITSIWLHLRRDHGCIGGAPSTRIIANHRRLHRAAVLAAHRELHRLVDNKQLGPFLQAGVDDRQDPRVRAACAQIAIALQIQLNAELTLPLSRSGVAGSGVGAWPRTTTYPVIE